jgi:hypothetical protein
MNHSLLIISLIWTLSLSNRAAAEYTNQVFKEGIRTPSVFPQGNPTGYPFIDLYNLTPLEFHFDELGTDRNTYNYAVIHCNHLWESSELSTSEYIKGFPEQEITQVDYSFNTTIEFVHHQFSFPNDMVIPTRSGNYAIVIFEGNEPTENIVLTFRIVIYESLVQIASAVNNSTLVSERFKNQEIDFTINYAGYQIFSPSQDVNVSIIQNGRWDNAIHGLKPQFIKTEELVYDYGDKNNFVGGSEWRYFEIKSVKFASSSVENITRVDDQWHAYLRPDELNGARAYQTNTDLNGKLFVRNDLGDDSYLEAEYIYVHFSLKSPEIADATISIECQESSFNANLFKCTYNKATQSYEANIPIKQGYYNYRYVLNDQYHSQDDISITEGNHSETENDYHIIVYCYDRGLGNDRVIAVDAVNSSFKK